MAKREEIRQKENIREKANFKNMQLNREELMHADIASLSHELTYRRYLMNYGQARLFFQKITVPEYLALHFMNEAAQEEASGRTYLQDIANQMQRPVRQISRVVKALRDRGLLTWSHDGDGSAGTYVTITDAGLQMLQEEETVLKNYYSQVIEHYGRDNFVQLLQLMRQLESVMEEELADMGGRHEIDENEDTSGMDEPNEINGAAGTNEIDRTAGIDGRNGIDAAAGAQGGEDDDADE